MKANERMVFSISTDAETKARLKEHAKQNHRSVSQLITDWVWKEKLLSEKNKSISNNS